MQTPFVVPCSGSGGRAEHLDGSWFNSHLFASLLFLHVAIKYVASHNILRIHSVRTLCDVYLVSSPPQVDDSVFCAGQIALMPCTLQLVEAGTRTQACLSFSYVKKVLEAVIGRLTLAHVVQAHCYATRRRDIPVIRAVWARMLRAAEEEQVR